MAFLGDKTIETRVMKVVRGKIAEAQKAYDLKKAEEETKRVAAHKKVDTDADAAISTHADVLVNGILGKIL